VKAEHVFDAYNRCAEWRVEDFIRNAKYCTAYPFAKFLQQEDLPALPDSLQNYKVFRGPFAKMIHARLVCRKDKRCAQFFFGLLQGVKRACNVIPRVYIQDAQKKHLKILTTDPARPDPQAMESFRTLAMKIAQGIKLTESTICSFTEPSKNASFERSRLHGGQETVVRQAYDQPTALTFLDKGGVTDQDSSHDVASAALGSMSHYDDLVAMAETQSGVGELRGAQLTADDRKEMILQDIQSTKDGALQCNIVPLAEPLKVRTISAGVGLPYYHGKPFQKTLWKWLRRYPQFVVIGEPLNVTHLQGILDREREANALILSWNLQPSRKSVKEGLRKGTIRYDNMEFWGNSNSFRYCPSDFWVSGDYAGATDSLKLPYTLAAFDAVRDELLNQCMCERSSELSFLKSYLAYIRKLLEPHILWYNDKGEALTKHCQDLGVPIVDRMILGNSSYIAVEQRNGQLMGSPISFPFLCLINIVCYWKSLNAYVGRYVPLRMLPVLVNGDDILFRSSKEHYALWRMEIAEVGFVLSLGKNYCHTEYLTINSELFRFYPDAKLEDPEFVKYDYFNIGLLMAQSKGRLADPRRRMKLSELYAWSVGGATDKLRAHRRFIHYNRLQLKEMTCDGTHTFNLFLPIIHGGLGFPVYPECEPEIKITNFQRRFASYLVYKTGESLALGKYPKKYFAALLSENTPLRSLIRRAGVPELKMGLRSDEAGWVEFIPPAVMTLGPFSAAQFISVDPECEYRFPARSLLRDFNRMQALLRNVSNTILSAQCRAMSNKELLYAECVVLKRKVLYPLPTEDQQ
jgi:hypothetical protein